MLKISCFISAVVLLTTAWGRPADSLRYYRLKGVDVSLGALSLYTGDKTSLNLLKAITPAEYSSDYDYGEATFGPYDALLNPARVCLGIIFGNSQRNNKCFVNKHELVFKFSFETYQNHNEYRNIKSWVNPNLIETVSLDYTYQTQTVGLGYQLATKTFLRNFALFGGVNADFGMVAYKRIDGPTYKYIYPSIPDTKNYYTNLLRGNALLGLKFNVSCDINLFIQIESGILHYGKDIGTIATYGGASFGIRYKFLEDQDKLKYKNEGFW